jgi:hypothetical protein
MGNHPFWVTEKSRFAASGSFATPMPCRPAAIAASKPRKSAVFSAKIGDRDGRAGIARQILPGDYCRPGRNFSKLGKNYRPGRPVDAPAQKRMGGPKAAHPSKKRR